jgi:hypothetical protein
MTIFTVFTLAGIGLCINRHRGWGALCFLIVLVYGFFSL